ncbi:MAG: RagB/SusD family nutrient uptake outer membrane protein, partial [Muribaculaceae bacterium]|nr:RagB/SusD family nutrient uptake outer membrane protein [Muribaculaceae bacterium]
MKKLIYIFAASALMLGSTSCNDQLNLRSTSQFIPEDIWDNETAADGYVIASYQTFADHSNFNIDGNRFYDAFSDIAKSTSWDMYEHQYNKTWMLSNTFGKNNAGPFNCWSTEYGRIKRANRLLNEIDIYGVPRYGEEWCDIRRAEVRFCRAISYFFLARVYGGVVIRTDKTGVTGGLDDGKYEEDVHRARVSEDETYDFIIDEMKWAIEHLPKTWADHEQYQNTYIGRATKGMVYGFLSRIALYGKRWDVAADAADQCKALGEYDLKKAETNDFDALLENYKSLFNCANDVANRKEVIFAIYYKKTIKVHDYDLKMRPFGDSKIERMGAVNARVVPTAELVDMYECKDGTEFDLSNPLWMWLHNDPYCDREPRFHATILYDGAEWEGRQIGTYIGDGINNGDDFYTEYANNASTSGHTPTGYYFRKFLMEGEEISTSNRSYNTEVILRYAEVLLNKAEALAEMGDIPGALASLNLVRERVGLPKKTNTDAPDYDSFMK